MKNIILLAAALLGMTAAQAQVADHVYGTKFTDNWSVTLKGGAVSPAHHYAFWKNARGIFGAEIRKQVTPVLGLGVEGEWTINTSSWNKAITPVWGLHSATMIDHQLVGAFAAFNLSNLFGGYKGAPRTLEFEAVAGAGWLHGYKTANSADMNSWYTKYGVNINWNLGESKAWTISLKPSIFWDMNNVNQYNAAQNGYSSTIAHDLQAGKSNRQQTRYNINNAAVELEAGVTYHFGNSNGQHYFTLCPYKYTQADIDQLNGQINNLRNQLSQAQSDLANCNARADQLARDLAACKAQKPQVIETKDNKESLESSVFFKIGKWDITRDQMPNVERIANYMKRNSAATVVVKGYASKDGPEAVNLKLAKNRAAAVKDCLVNKYKINAKRIDAAGNGISEMFSEPEWNRVSICTIDKNLGK